MIKEREKERKRGRERKERKTFGIPKNRKMEKKISFFI